MVRNVLVFGAVVAAFQLTCSQAQSAAVTESGVHRAHQVLPVHRVAVPTHHPEVLHRKLAARQVARPTARREPAAEAAAEPAIELPTPAVDTADGAPTSLAYSVPATDASGDGQNKPDIDAWAAEPPPVLPVTPPALSEQETEVSQIASAQGDKTFLMVDKALGRILLFENGQPVYAGPALTGESRADQMPKSELNAKFDTLNALDTKITPAGRFTVERGYDEDVGGPLFDIHEIQGKDWGIAIHKVYLGIPAEHRDVRIKSPNEADKHITFGCINVTPDAVRLLLHELPAKGLTPLYVLPNDVNQTAAYFAPRSS